MSTPPGHPSAYPYPHSQSPGGYGPPPAQNPYTQSAPPGGPYSVPAQPGPYGGPPGTPFPPSGGTGGGSGGAGRSLLWAVAGSLVASALWGGGVLLLGGDPDPELGGYKAREDLCASVDHASFDKRYPGEDDDPSSYTSEHPALDSMSCGLSLKSSGAQYTDAYISYAVELHKKTDPSAEFTASWETYDQRSDENYKYEVEKVAGIGDEAFLVIQDSSSDTDSGSVSVHLAVRDGWMTYQMSWTTYMSMADEDSTKKPPTTTETTEWLKTDSRASMEKLRS